MEKKAIYEEIGKTLAPVEIDSDDAMELFGITKKDLVPFMVGSSHIMVYPYPAPEEVCREMLRELWQRYKQEYRSTRCLIPGARGGMCVCPEKYSCADCPVDLQQRVPRLVSLDYLQDEGLELEIPSPESMSMVYVNAFLDRLAELDPRYAEIVKLRGVGYTEPEISRILQVPLHVVKYARQKIREFAAEYFDIPV